MELHVNGTMIAVRGYSLASLLWGLRLCTLGYTVKEKEENELIRTIIDYIEFGEAGNVYLLSYTPGIGLHVTPLGRKD
ncbi:MAG: hypothetical protein GXO43_09535 [Crenarchaeota archaeon]|nr:hypothetical protein [Thermoproteota archaeon]